jgi:hypothetical protein
MRKTFIEMGLSLEEVTPMQTAQLYGINSENQCKSKEGGGHRTIATITNPKRNPEAGRHDDSTQRIHIQIRRMQHAFL